MAERTEGIQRAMKVKELITRLLDEPMDAEVELQIKDKHLDNYGNECSGYLFHIDDIDRFGGLVCINFTDWRDGKDEERDCETCEHEWDGHGCWACLSYEEYNYKKREL